MAAPHAVIRRRFFLYSQGFQVAVIGQEIAGFCCAALFDQDARLLELDEYFPAEHIPKGRYCFLFGLTVNPIYRRRGIARSLVGKELETARKKSCRKVQVIANSLSRPLFEQWHFQAVTELQHLFKNHTDLMPRPVLMEMDLETG
jgi:GNAT superfamily N-acetyltransferase